MSQHLLLNGGKKKRLFYEWMLSRPDIVFIADSKEGGEESLFCETTIDMTDNNCSGIISGISGWDEARPDRARPPLRRGLRIQEGEAIATITDYF